MTGLPSGLADFDRLTCGLQPGALYVIGARPSVGKTALALGIAAHVSVGLRRPTLLASLEMPHEELMSRLMSIVGRVDAQRVRSGDPTHDDWAGIATAIQHLSGAPLVLDDDASATVAAIRARARRVRARYHDLGLIVVDYLQLIGQTDLARPENRQLQVDEVTRQLKLMARDLQVPVIATAQVGRAVEARADKRPLLSDLRESGAIEAHSDVVATLYRDELYDPSSADRGTAELNVLKHRNGPTGMIRLAFMPSRALFASMATL